MRWLPCASSHQGRLPPVARFGHSCTVIDARDEWGTELIVLFGGVAAASSAAAGSDPAFPAAANSADQQHTALADVLVLQAEADTWFAPDMATSGASASAAFHASGGAASASAPVAPEPRAFHAAAAVGKRVFVFGGHVLVAEAERKRRIFYSDLWSLDTVRWPLLPWNPPPPRPPLRWAFWTETFHEPLRENVPATSHAVPSTSPSSLPRRAGPGAESGLCSTGKALAAATWPH